MATIKSKEDLTHAIGESDLFPILDDGGSGKSVAPNQIRPIIYGDNGITVGAKGRVANLADAITLRNTMTHTLLLSTTGTVTGTSAGTVAVQMATTAASMATWIGEDVYVQIGGAGPLIKMFVITNTTLFSQHPFYADLAAVQFDLYRVNRANIVLLPGYREALTANHSIPGFTCLTSLGLGTAELYCSGSGTLDVSDVNEVTINGIQTNQAHNLAIGLTVTSANTDGKTLMCDQLSIRNSRFEGGAVDTFLFDGKMGTVQIDSTVVDGVWDVFRVGMPARTFLTNNPLFRSVGIPGITSTAGAVKMDGPTNAYPGRTLNISGNVIAAENFNSTTGSVTPIEIAPAGVFQTATIRNNTLIGRNHAGNSQVRGIWFKDGGNIDISGNLFDLSNVGALVPQDIAVSPVTAVTIKSDGTNRKVGDAAFNNVDSLGRYSVYTNLA